MKFINSVLFALAGLAPIKVLFPEFKFGNVANAVTAFPKEISGFIERKEAAEARQAVTESLENYIEANEKLGNYDSALLYKLRLGNYDITKVSDDEINEINGLIKGSSPEYRIQAIITAIGIVNDAPKGQKTTPMLYDLLAEDVVTSLLDLEDRNLLPNGYSAAEYLDFISKNNKNPHKVEDVKKAIELKQQTNAFWQNKIASQTTSTRSL